MYPSINPLDGISKQEKMAILQKVDAIARSEDERVIQVNASLSGLYEIVLVVNHQGQLVADVRPLVSLHVSVIVEESGLREHGRSGGGGRGDYLSFFSDDELSFYAKQAVREGLTNLSAKPAPAGTMPVVLGAGWPGVLLHEAVGHGLEGDFNRKGVSAFSGRLGQKVAGDEVTVVDNGTLENRRGSLSVDDEGTPTQETVLIENGILKGYLFDKLNARLMGVESTGNGRRESYAHIPMPRMTNTYMKNGQYSQEEIISSVKKGVYAANFSGGQVDITSGKFVFSASEAYMIENGKVTYPIKGAMLIGSGPTVMPLISMVGNDLALDRGIGVCGKDGQSVPVGVGQPSLRIDEITVGGTG
jgi:TldD protein